MSFRSFMVYPFLVFILSYFWAVFCYGLFTAQKVVGFGAVLFTTCGHEPV